MLNLFDKTEDIYPRRANMLVFPLSSQKELSELSCIKKETPVQLYYIFMVLWEAFFFVPLSSEENSPEQVCNMAPTTEQMPITQKSHLMPAECDLNA